MKNAMKTETNFPIQNKNSIPDISDLLGKKTDCVCGTTHTCEIKNVVIKNGAINELPALCEGYENVLLVCDENTRRVCANDVEALLGDKITAKITFSGASVLIPNEDAVAKVKALITDKTDLIVGVGSGVINDLCKHVSYDASLPYYIVATAPSMDGYASKGAAMLFGGMKITTNAAVPTAIIADTSVLKNAPLEMIQAGYGDIIGKYSCLNDWRLSNVVNGEALCPFIYDLTFNTVEAVAKMGKAIISRDEKSIELLMRALVIVGVAMAYMGNSRPASGSEHHLSHYFEVVGILRNEPYFCHGTDVAYSTYVTAKLRKKLLNIDFPEGKPFSEAEWESEINRVYGTSGNSTVSEGVIETQRKLGWIFNDMSAVYQEKWEAIKDVLKDSPTPEEILSMLDCVGLSIKDFDSMYTEEKIADAIKYAKDLKDRYTVLWLYASLKNTI